MVQKIINEINAMRSSLDLSYTKTVLKASGNKQYWVECERSQDCLLDEEGNDVGFPIGTLLGVEVYFVRDNDEVDCCTVQLFSDVKEWQQDIKDFVRMWGR